MQVSEKSILADAMHHAGVRSRYLKDSHDSLDRYPDQFECVQACVEIRIDADLMGVVVSCLISRDPEIQDFIDRFRTKSERLPPRPLGREARAELAQAISTGRLPDGDLTAIVTACTPGQNLRASSYLNALVSAFVALHRSAETISGVDLGLQSSGRG